jgi:hypothetical protein
MEQNDEGLLAFTDSIIKDKGISEEDRMLIEVKVWNFLGKHIERYTMNDSTSVPIEIAEELLNSICFLLELELREAVNASKILIDEDIDVLIKNSWSKVESLVEDGQKLLEGVIKSTTNIENISYNDTLDEIGKCFKKYDYRFFADKINCSIDYQLSNPVSEKLKGIEYINAYLKSLLIENEFCICFDKDKIIGILNSYCPDYRGLLINIFEPVLTNVIGLDILDEDIFRLEISNLQRNVLLDIFNSLSKNEILSKLRSSAKRVCSILGIASDERVEYIQKTVVDIFPRIEVGLSEENLDGIFLSFNYQLDSKESNFIDNEPMDDKRLRELINEINDCRFTSDKIAIVKQEIHSLSDLVEVLNVCFWGDEVLELFKALSKEELYILNHYLDNKGDGEVSESGWENKKVRID